MNIHGYSRVAVGRPNLVLGDITANTQSIIDLYDQALTDQADLILMPELTVTGYTMADLFHQKALLDDSLKALDMLTKHTTGKHTILVVGLPLEIDNAIYNCGAVLYQGQILGIVPKSYLPTYNEYYETRWFAKASHLMDKQILLLDQIIPIGTDLIFTNTGDTALSFGVEICEDLWAPIPPSTYQGLQGALVLLNLSASNELIAKSDYRRSLVAGQSARLMSAYLYCSSGFGESSTDLTFGGHSIIAENGSIRNESDRFSLNKSYLFTDIDLDKLIYDRIHSNTYRECKTESSTFLCRKIGFKQANSTKEIMDKIDPHPFVPSNSHRREERCREIFSIQTSALAKRLTHIGHPKAIIGISGGLDSTLALLVTVKTFDLLKRDRKDIIGVTMPGFGTTDRTYNNALELMKALHITILEIPIAKAVTQHFIDIDHDPNLHDITYENSQARERTQLLMDLSNKYGGIVIGTGDLSELALGWATFNGDHMSMYGVNSSIPKTLVRYLVEWVSINEESKKAKEILADILHTPVSPELLPPTSDGNIAQKTEEVVGPYELHDFYLYYMLRFGFSPEKIYGLAVNAFEKKYDSLTILNWMEVFYKRFFAQQFKRSTLPDGPKVGSICLSPRGDLRMPSDSTGRLWLSRIESLRKSSC